MEEQKKQQANKQNEKKTQLKITSEPKLMLNKSFFAVKDLLPPNNHEYYKKKEQQLASVLPSLFEVEERLPKLQKEKKELIKEIKQTVQIQYPYQTKQPQLIQLPDALEEKILKQQSQNKLRLFLESENQNSKRKIKELPESAFICPICLDESTTNIYISKCSHKAHLQCVQLSICWEKWLETKLECPLCKSRVRKKQLKEDKNTDNII